MILGHRIALDPTDKQREYFAKAAGCARFVYNLALDEWNRRYEETGKTPNHMDIRKDFNAFKYEAFPWMTSVHRDCCSEPFRNLQKAFNRFFKKTGSHPKFHKKGRKDSFYAANDSITVDGERVRLPRIGWIRMHTPLRFVGKIMSATVSRTADRWYLSIQVDVGEYKKARITDSVVGVDVGITSALTLSTGEKIEGPKPLKKELRKLKCISRKASRQKRGGKNQKKTYAKVARIHARIANIRRDFWHKVTTRLCRENQAIGIETLNVKGMARNKKLAIPLADVSIGMMKPMLDYKSKIYNNVIHQTDLWYASSKICSCCGAKKEKLSLSERVFNCESCGAAIDRDVNAAKNEENELRKFLATRQEIPEVIGKSNVCGLGMLVKAPCEAESFEVCDLMDSENHNTATGVSV